MILGPGDVHHSLARPSLQEPLGFRGLSRPCSPHRRKRGTRQGLGRGGKVSIRRLSEEVIPETGSYVGVRGRNVGKTLGRRETPCEDRRGSWAPLIWGTRT